MKYERYLPVYEADDLSLLEFMSIGKYGMIKKRVMFTKMEIKGMYNLAFGNIGMNGNLDDEIISDNGDRNEILATVALAVDRYTQRYPRRWVYFRGNTPAKTRLYRMAIGLNLWELSKKFEIFVEVDGEDDFVLFQRNMVVEGFLIRRKIVF